MVKYLTVGSHHRNAGGVWCATAGALAAAFAAAALSCAALVGIEDRLPDEPSEPSPAPEDAGDRDAASQGDGQTPRPDAALVETFISDLPYSVVANGWGPVEKDESNGERDAGDGLTMQIGGVAYKKGLGVHAESVVTLALDGRYRFFFADVGVDDEMMERGSVVFKVLLDGVAAYESGTLTGADVAQKVSVDVMGKRELKLVVTDAADGIGSDHADWANARLAR